MLKKALNIPEILSFSNESLSLLILEREMLTNSGIKVTKTKLVEIPRIAIPTATVQMSYGNLKSWEAPRKALASPIKNIPVNIRVFLWKHLHN